MTKQGYIIVIIAAIAAIVLFFVVKKKNNTTVTEPDNLAQNSVDVDMTGTALSSTPGLGWLHIFGL
jgi:YbbR domain-containing protein